MAERQRTLITGVIGSDTHIVGDRILSMVLERAGYKVVSLGALTPAGDFIKAAVETSADAILVSSLYGQGELDCRGFRELCIEAGLDDILLYVGGQGSTGIEDADDRHPVGFGPTAQRSRLPGAAEGGRQRELPHRDVDGVPTARARQRARGPRQRAFPPPKR